MEQHLSDVLPVVPTAVASVTFDSGFSAQQGNELTPTQVKDAPKVEWSAEPNTYYLLGHIDVDYTRRHWLVGNIPGNDVGKGETLGAYIGAGPNRDSGLHRYVFLIYKQSGKIDFDEKNLSIRSVDRKNFSITKFAEKYHLGNPVAGNFYKAQYDDFVPILFKLTNP